MDDWMVRYCDVFWPFEAVYCIPARRMKAIEAARSMAATSSDFG